jgi:hypothetical protein
VVGRGVVGRGEVGCGAVAVPVVQYSTMVFDEDVRQWFSTMVFDDFRAWVLMSIFDVGL